MSPNTSPRYTVVSFHAHPDDEALLTSGTLARAAAEGHRVVLVVATAGEAGLAAASLGTTDLATRRAAELKASAAAIGAARVEVMGYADSGFPVAEPRPVSIRADAFSNQDPEEVAIQLAAILVEERADVLTIYDPSGGYGHPDHVQVHRAGLRAAALASTPVVLEATLDRARIGRAVRVLRALSRTFPMPDLPSMSDAYTARADLTHRVDVRRFLDAKRRSLQAHASQAGGDSGPRTLALLLRLPRPFRRLVLGQEWFREVGRQPTGVLLDDIFATLRATR
jgi:LmbE family N-acetylglucosaminyl deacetylase